LCITIGIIILRVLTTEKNEIPGKRVKKEQTGAFEGVDIGEFNTILRTFKT